MTGITSDVIADLLRQKYSKDKYAFMCEVRSATGYARKVRSADAIAFDLWPSTGQEVSGFEIKVSRADFKRELDDPSKSQEIFLFCDHWWIVAPEGIISPESIPKVWGFIEVTTARKLKITIKAPKLKPVAPTVGFMMSVMRSFSQQVDPQAEINKQVAIATERAFKEGKATADEALKTARTIAMQNADQAWVQARRDKDELDRILGIIGCSRYNVDRYPLKEAARLIQKFGSIRGLIQQTQGQLASLLDDTRITTRKVVDGINEFSAIVNDLPPQPEEGKEFEDVEPGV